MTSHKKRIIARRGNESFVLLSDEIPMLYSENKITIAVDQHNRKYICDSPLSALQAELNPQLFFRVTRQHLINANFVHHFKTVEGSKLEIHLSIEKSLHVITVNRNMAAIFKSWIIKA